MTPPVVLLTLILGVIFLLFATVSEATSPPLL